MQSNGAAAIRGARLTKKFRSGDTALVVFADLDFEVARGEQLSLIGESGAGKSTLLYLLGGLDRPSEGTIYFGQKDIARLSDTELDRKSTRLNSSHVEISYAVFCLKKKKNKNTTQTTKKPKTK